MSAPKGKAGEAIEGRECLLVTHTKRRCIARPALRRDVLLPKVRDIESQGLSHVIRG